MVSPFLCRTKGNAPWGKPLTKQLHENACQSNLEKISRALQLPNNRSILLEGAPGVGKTSIVVALAELLGRPCVRINLSEQTDISELFGADLPVEGESGKFAWHDGPLLSALKKGDWIVLDEMKHFLWRNSTRIYLFNERSQFNK